MPRDEQYLVEIIEAAADITRWLGGVTIEDWSANEILHNAVLFKLITIGEAARGVSTGLRGRYPDVGWRDATAFRNFAVHEYFAVEWDRVWVITHRSVPMFVEQVSGVLRNEFPDVADRLQYGTGS